MDELITYVNGKGYETRFWASLGGNGFVGDTPVNTDATAHFWGVNYADFTQMVKDGYGCINNVYPLLYIVPGAGTFRDYLDIAWMYDTWEATMFDGGFTPARRPSPDDGKRVGPVVRLQNRHVRVRLFRPPVYPDHDHERKELVRGETGRAETGKEFLERIDRVDDYAPGANPARVPVPSEGEWVARYDFESVEGEVVRDGGANGYDALLHGLELVENDGGHALRLDGQGYLSLPSIPWDIPIPPSLTCMWRKIPRPIRCCSMDGMEPCTSTTRGRARLVTSEKDTLMCSITTSTPACGTASRCPVPRPTRRCRSAGFPVQAGYTTI